MVKNLLSLLATQVGTWAMSAFILVAVPRQVGAEQFGRLSFAVAYSLLFGVVATFGVGTYLIKEVSRNPDDAGRYVANGAVLGAVYGGAVALVAMLVAVALRLPTETLQLVAISLASMWVGTIYNPLMAGLYGVNRMAQLAFWDLVRSYVAGLTGLLTLRLTGSVVAYSFVFNLSCLIPVAAAYLLQRRRLRGARLDLALCRRILVGGFPFFISSALLLVHGKIDVPMLQALDGTESVAWYSLAYQWVGMPALFAVSVATAFFPTLAAHGQALTPRFMETANRGLRLVAAVSIPAAVGIALVAGPVLHLVYGNEFDESIPLMRILAMHIPLVGLNVLLSSVAVAADRQKQAVQLGIAAAVFNPLANLVAIPVAARAFGNGAIGAATVTVLTEILLFGGFLLLRPAGVLDRATASRLLRTVGATLTMVPVVVVLGGAPIPVPIAAGAATYAVAALVFGAVTPPELREAIDKVRLRRRHAEAPA